MVCIGVMFLYYSGKERWYQGSVSGCCTCTTQVKENSIKDLFRGAVTFVTIK